MLDSKDLVANKAQFASATHTQEMDHMRKIIADHMKTSLETSAHVHVVNEVNMTAIANYINEKNSSFEEQEGFSLTFTPFILDAVINRNENIFPLVGPRNLFESESCMQALRINLTQEEIHFLMDG